MKREQITFNIPQTYCNLRKLDIKSDTMYLGAHYHSELEIVFVKSGSVLCCFEGNPIHIPENHIMVIGSNTIHNLTYDNTVAQIYYLQIDIAKIVKIIYPEFATVPLILNSNLKKYTLFSEKSHIYRLFQNILCELEVKKTHFETAVIGGFIQLTSYLQREEIVPDYRKFFENSSFKKIFPIILYANEHFFEKVSLDDVCNTVHIDKFYLCKIFKKETGITFFQYLNRVRLQNAEKLLKETNKSITQISLECGFSTIQYFNLAFSKTKGCSPSLYRKSHYKTAQYNHTVLF